MATTLKILGQVAPSATTETDLYAPGAATSAVVSSLIVCNRANTQGTFRVSVSAAGGATASKDYIYYDVTIAANDTFIATIVISLATTDKIRVYSSSASMSFSAFGQEIS